MKYTVLSPWAQVNAPEKTIFCERPNTLEGKTIGLFAIFKQTSPLVLDIIGQALKEKYGCRLKAIQYKKDTEEIEHDKEFQPILEQWLSDVDLVIGGYGDAGSCAMYMAINTVYCEKLAGKPGIGIIAKGLSSSAMQGASSHFAPGFRLVEVPLPDLSMRVVDEECIETLIRPAVMAMLPQIEETLLRPMQPEEAPVVIPPQTDATELITGDLDTLNRIFYEHGWTNGTPIVPPTKSKVREMLRGTPLKANTIVGYLPPRMGIATVEKIAINAVMAGCLPIHLPAVIAAVEAMLDPAMHIVGWTCSVRSWMGPFICINGPVRHDLKMTTDNTMLAGYRQPATAIARAVAYCILNIAGVRPKLEDNAFIGGECRFGVCFAENEENSPWESHAADFGFADGENTVSLFFPVGRQKIISMVETNLVPELLKRLCIPKDIGFTPGCMYILTPPCIKALADAGYSKQDVIDYIVEYNRRELEPGMLRWVTGNNHVPKGTPLPVDTSYSVRTFWNKDHIAVICGGSNVAFTGMALVGGGDHGGPTCAKMKLPKNWDKLVEQYATEPHYAK